MPSGTKQHNARIHALSTRSCRRGTSCRPQQSRFFHLEKDDIFHSSSCDVSEHKESCHLVVDVMHVVLVGILYGCRVSSRLVARDSLAPTAGIADATRSNYQAAVIKHSKCFPICKHTYLLLYRQGAGDPLLGGGKKKKGCSLLQGSPPSVSIATVMMTS
jgi:hypothetical protein